MPRKLNRPFCTVLIRIGSTVWTLIKHAAYKTHVIASSYSKSEWTFTHGHPEDDRPFSTSPDFIYWTKIIALKAAWACTAGSKIHWDVTPPRLLSLLVAMRVIRRMSDFFYMQLVKPTNSRCDKCIDKLDSISVDSQREDVGRRSSSWAWTWARSSEMIFKNITSASFYDTSYRSILSIYVDTRMIFF